MTPMPDIHAIYPSSKDIIELVENDLADGAFHDGSGFPYIRATSADFDDRWDGRNEGEEDELVQHLFVWSLSKYISSVERIRASRLGEVLGYWILIDDSKDGQTNITSEVIETLRKLIS